MSAIKAFAVIQKEISDAERQKATLILSPSDFGMEVNAGSEYFGQPIKFEPGFSCTKVGEITKISGMVTSEGAGENVKGEVAISNTGDQVTSLMVGFTPLDTHRLLAQPAMSTVLTKLGIVGTLTSISMTCYFTEMYAIKTIKTKDGLDSSTDVEAEIFADSATEFLLPFSKISLSCKASVKASTLMPYIVKLAGIDVPSEVSVLFSGMSVTGMVFNHNAETRYCSASCAGQLDLLGLKSAPGVLNVTVDNAGPEYFGRITTGGVEFDFMFDSATRLLGLSASYVQETELTLADTLDSLPSVVAGVVSPGALPQGLSDSISEVGISLVYSFETKTITTFSLRLEMASRWNLLENFLTLQDINLVFRGDRLGSTWSLSGGLRATCILGDSLELEASGSVPGGLIAMQLSPTKSNLVLTPRQAAQLSVPGNSSASIALNGLTAQYSILDKSFHLLMDVSAALPLPNPDGSGVISLTRCRLEVNRVSGKTDIAISGQADIGGVTTVLTAQKGDVGWSVLGAVSNLDTASIVGFLQNNGVPLPMFLARMKIDSLGFSYSTGGAGKGISFDLVGGIPIFSDVEVLAALHYDTSDTRRIFSGLLRVAFPGNVEETDISVKVTTGSSAELQAAIDSRAKPISLASFFAGLGCPQSDLMDEIMPKVTAAQIICSDHGVSALKLEGTLGQQVVTGSLVKLTY
ncbi:hypothetical protein GCM10010245_88700 [Streptomyces spectabilis]|uniref:Uncharacterized protein n=1 Tax=Streptomyces spectabilis TaxID=68270 RepID=A0A7W8B444_STRST|nr:hypothetical protein [Streptomyces spectabilis]MBB5110010.1 hypothetical protein [Streptomyces spectabilis]GGV55930.1 hypothetical protein GCM10010245_88700 [Streptomyces spectabilis]